VIQLEVPNLDACAAHDLEELSRTFRLLSYYCEATASAQKHRQVGQISHALDFERLAQTFYQQLPAEHRW
jgi:hypothetical protein